MSKYDVIVIGGGHNGLTTAALLAKKGKRVIVLEKREVLGGIAAGEEFYPGHFNTGLLHDTGGVRNHVIKELRLENHGLKISDHRADTTILSEDGASITLSSNPIETNDEISRYSKKDAEAYENYRSFISKVSGIVNDIMDHAPPKVDLDRFDLTSFLVLAKKGMMLKGLGNKTMMELLRVAPMSVADYLNELFETDFLKAGLAASALYGSYAGPWSAYTTINLLLWESTTRVSVAGGPSALIKSLEIAARSSGVEIQTGAEVERILLNNHGDAMGVRLKGGREIYADKIAASCTPKETFLNLIDDLELDYQLSYWIEKLRCRGTTAKINLAIKDEVRLNGRLVAHARTGNNFTTMEKAFDPVKYGDLTERPFLDIHVPSISDPTLAPEGHSIVSILAHQVPYYLKGGWTDQAKQTLGESVLKTLESYCEGISASCLFMEVLTPADLEARYSLTEGHIFHGEHFVDQLVTRPIPSCSRYRTPIKGLYLCGSGSHPGGGITCAPGSLAVKEILA